MKKLLLLGFVFFYWMHSGTAQSLVHYWNFNQFDTEVSHLNPSFTTGGASLTYIASASSANDYQNGTGQNFDVQNLNARNGDPSGNHLRINNPIGASIIFGVPTTGFNQVVFKYATRRSGSGAGTQEIAYSLDGTNFIDFTTISPNNGDPSLQTLDFSAISGSDNNPDFKIRINFSLGAGGAVGNNRFDNVTLEGVSSGADVLPPTVNFSPAPQSAGLAVNTTPSITFNEPVRNADNSAITSENAGALVVFKMNDASGTDVPFNAAFAGQTITITPLTSLVNNQQYYLALKANVVEDLSDNTLTSVLSSSFTTITTQTQFHAGDLLFVGYQMNAVPNEDRIAFITLVDILPGTNIFFTDAKYTNNMPAQCSGGITWTAPAEGVAAGKVITINNDAGTADIGTVTGNTFGLSANGDQVIVYTGTSETPDFITAISSNAWLVSNTSCSGSFSMLPASLTEGTNALNLSAAPGNTTGNTVNAYYTGVLTGTPEEIRSRITNPANWTGTASGTPAQNWPSWNSTGEPAPNTAISFNAAVLSVAEDAGQLSIQLNLLHPSASSVDLVVKTSAGTADANDFTLTTQTLHFTSTSSAVQTITIPVADDALNEQDEYFVLTLENPSGLTVGSNRFITVYIRDNDRQAPLPNKQIELEYVGSYDPSGSNAATSEIVVYDSATRRLFSISAIQNQLDIADFSDPAAVKPVRSVDMTPYGGITSVAIRDGIVAVAAPNADQQANGAVIFFNTDGVFQKQVTVGALPDMITFTPDGKKVMTANEGQPNDSYTVDPEGSISIIDVSGGMASISQAKVTTLDFTSFNAQANSLIAAGVRKSSISQTLSQDLEPEYITFSADSKTAWAILQEANAFAVINLETNKVTEIWPLGKKDHSLPGNGFDASDRGTDAHISNWPVKGLYMPDGIGSYTVNGTTYIVGANEGDDREYSAFNERVRVNASSYVLDTAAFPNAAILKEDNNLGRLRITTASGDTDGDGDFDEIHLIGGRSFAIWNTATKSVVYDSGDDFEQFTSKTPLYSPIFNADNESNTRKSRSTSKGPEPEGVVLANIEGKQYAFITLERVGGVMVYDITNPAEVKFVDYKNPRNLSAFGGDNGPEGVFYISSSQSPDGKHYLIVANEISGSISIYRLTKNTDCTPVAITAEPVNPAPVNNGAGVATISVQTNGAGPVSFQWQENGIDLTDGGVYSGVNTAALTITDPASVLNGKKYRVFVTNCLGNNSDTSTAVTLTVRATPILKVKGITVNENEGTASVQVCLSAAINKPVNFSYTTVDGSAHLLLDYIPKAGNKTIPAGQTCATINIPIVNNNLPEQDEQFYLNISNPSNAAITDHRGVITITDTDVMPYLSVSDVTVNEHTGSAKLNICLSAPVQTPVSVFYTTSNGTAKSGSDYTSQVGLKIIPAGQTCVNVTIPLKNDRVKEQSEYFTVDLVLPLNAVIADGKGRVTVTDDDGKNSGEENEIQVQVTPNPFQSSFKVSIESLIEEKVTLSLVDSRGTALMQKRIQLMYGINQATIDGLGKLSPGIYYLRVITQSGTRSRQLIKR